MGFGEIPRPVPAAKQKPCKSAQGLTLLSPVAPSGSFQERRGRGAPTSRLGSARVRAGPVPPMALQFCSWRDGASPGEQSLGARRGAGCSVPPPGPCPQVPFLGFLIVGAQSRLSGIPELSRSHRTRGRSGQAREGAGGLWRTCRSLQTEAEGSFRTGKPGGLHGGRGRGGHGGEGWTQAQQRVCGASAGDP